MAKKSKALASLKIDAATHKKFKAFVERSGIYTIGGLAGAILEEYLKTGKTKARCDGSER